jgi:hypothetical protein
VLEESSDSDTVDALAALAFVESMLAGAEADELSRRALDLGQRLDLRGLPMANLLLVRGMVHSMNDQFAQAETYYREAYRMAAESGGTVEAARALGNLADSASAADPAAAAGYAKESMAIHRRMGAQWYLVAAEATFIFASLEIGDWDGAAETAAGAMGTDCLDGIDLMRDIASVVWMLRGEVARARELIGPLDEPILKEDPQEASIRLYVRAYLEYLDGRPESALAFAREAVVYGLIVGGRHEGFRWAWPLASRAAYDLGDQATGRELVDLIADRLPGQVSPLVWAERELAIARLQADGSERLDAIEGAVESLRHVGSPFHLAHALLDQAEAIRSTRPTADVAAFVDEAVTIASKVGAEQVATRATQLANRLSLTRPIPATRTLTEPAADRT